MKNPFASLYKIQIKPVPKKVEQALEANFPGALNIDWEHKKTGYESVFYLNDVEHIALFSSEGELLEYKKNLWQNEIPLKIAAECNSRGEIMNGISIRHGKETFYEIIIRDPNLNRTLLLFNENGEQLKAERI